MSRGATSESSTSDGDAAAVTIVIEDSPVFFVGGWCGNTGCGCYDPGPPCDEFMGPVGRDDGRVDLRCPRCGWSEGAHGRRLAMAFDVPVARLRQRLLGAEAMLGKSPSEQYTEGYASAMRQAIAVLDEELNRAD